MHAPVIMELDQGKGLFLALNETIYVSTDSEAKKIFFHTKHHTYYLVRSNYDLALALLGTSFEEIRRGSVFVNMKHIIGFDGNKMVSIPTAGDEHKETLQVSKRYMTQFKQRYMEYNLGG